MAPILQKPKASRTKESSTVSIRTIGKDLGDDGEPAGRRRPEPVNTNIGKRRAVVQLIPQPSDDPRDPLNWPTYKKEVAFSSILLSAAVGSILKTLFVSTNSVIAVSFNVSFVAAASLTGVPYIFAAASSLGASILAAVIGKRSIYVIGGILMLAGALGNMHAQTFAQFMVSRIIQGFGWGVTDGLVQDSIRDLFFVHERNLRANIFTLSSLIFTWGSPILGGHLSQSMDGFREAIMAITLIQAFSVFFLIFFVPETAFARLSGSINPSISNSISGPSASALKTYLSSLKPVSYRAAFSVKSALRPIRALGAPTALLTLLLTFPLIVTSYGIANSLSLLFSAPMPTFIFPTRLGFIFIFPVLFSLLTFSLVCLASYIRSRPSKQSSNGIKDGSLISVFPGVLLGASGLLAFGLYTSGELSPRTVRSGGSVFALTTSSDNLSLKVVSALFGMLVASSIILSYSVKSHITAFSTSPTRGSDEKEAHLEAGYRVWLDFFTGIFVIAIPSWIEMEGTSAGGMMNGLRDTSIALGVLQLVLASSAGAILWVWGKEVRKLDRKVMELGVESRGVGGSLELRKWESKGSFFDV